MTGDKDRWVRFQVKDSTLPGWGAFGFSATGTRVLVPTASLQAYEKDRRASARRTRAQDAGHDGAEASHGVELDGSHPAPGASDGDPSQASPATPPATWPDPIRPTRAGTASCPRWRPCCVDSMSQRPP